MSKFAPKSPQDVRKAIILHMRRGQEYSARELSERLGQTVNRIGINLRHLKRMGLVSGERVAKHAGMRFWRLADRDASP